MDIINILKKINLQGKFGTGMVIGAGNLLSAIGSDAFVNSSTELYSQLKEPPKIFFKNSFRVISFNL